MKKVKRFDRQGIGFAYETKEGFLEAYGSKTTRYGVFTYLEDGQIVKELRRPEELLKAESLGSMKKAVITFDHPAGLVDSKNAKSLQIGMVGESINFDGQWVLNDLKITDGQSIEKIDGGNGSAELSWGYECDLLNEPGVWNGINYDREQINIEHNHLAVVESARAGSEARIKYDSKDTINITEDEEKQFIKDCSNEKTCNKETINKGYSMEKVTVKNRKYDAAPEVADLVSELREDNKNLKEESKNLKTDKADLEGKVLGLQTEIEKLKKQDSSKDVMKKLELVEKCRPFLKKDTKDLVAISDRDLMTQTLVAIKSDIKLDSDESEELLKVRFDSALQFVDPKALEKIAETVTKGDGVSREDKAKKAESEFNKRYASQWMKGKK